MNLFARNLFVCTLLLVSAATAVADNAGSLEAETKLMAEEAKKDAQAAAIEAAQARIAAQTAAQVAATAQVVAATAGNLAEQLADTAVSATEVSKIELAVTAINAAQITASDTAEDAEAASVTAQAAAQAATIAAQQAAASAAVVLDFGLTNWIITSAQAADTAAQDATMAQIAANEALQSAAAAADAATNAATALKIAEKALAAATYTGTDIADWDWSVWDIEGYYPVVDNTLLFDALAAQHTTSSGNGWRHELKIKSSERVAMTQVFEDFSANVRLDISTGTKTIITQHHASDTGTIMKLYVSDASESDLYNGIANDGIFDVYVRLLSADGYGEQKKAFGTIESGDNFDFQVINDHGFVTVSAMGDSFSLEIQDSPASYLKFGNYLQAQDAETGVKVENSADFAQFYADAGITESEVTFTNLNYLREVDAPEVEIDPKGQSVAITDTSITSTGKLRIKLGNALPVGKVTVNVKYAAEESETTYLTLFGASTSSANAVADLKMDSGYAAGDDNVGIKLRSTDAWIADYPAGKWSHIAIAWDSVDTYQFTVTINGTDVGTYDMNFIDSVETIELKLASNSNVTDHTFYVDDLNVYSDTDATDLVFSEDFESIMVGTDLSAYDSNYSSSTNSAVITDVANANGYTGPVIEEEGAPSQSVAITDVATDSSGKLRLRLDDAIPTGKVSVKVKYDVLETETAYITLFGSSTSTANAIADLKMDSGYSPVDGNVGIKLRSTDTWVADYPTGEWATISVAWDNLVTNQITITVNDLDVGSYAMYNNFDVETVEIKLGSNANTSEYTLYVDDLTVYADNQQVFADDFEALEVGTNLTGYGDYNANTFSAVVNDVENATVAPQIVAHS